MGIIVGVWIMLMLAVALAGYLTNDEEWAAIQVTILGGGVVAIGIAGLIVS